VQASGISPDIAQARCLSISMIFSMEVDLSNDA